jgi:hypothetical protein
MGKVCMRMPLLAVLLHAQVPRCQGAKVPTVDPE